MWVSQKGTWKRGSCHKKLETEQVTNNYFNFNKNRTDYRGIN